MHNYDFAWPTGKGLFGPADWLKAPMTKAKVPKGLRRELFKELLNRLRDAQLILKKEKAMGGWLRSVLPAPCLKKKRAKSNGGPMSFIPPRTVLNCW